MTVLVAGMVGLSPTAAAQELIYGMTALSNAGVDPGIGLVSFQSNNPGAATNIGSFTGVVAGHGVRSIDFRPSTGQLYAISTDATGGSAQLYTVNLSTAALTSVGSGFSLGTNDSVGVEMDFNPVTDQIRVLTTVLDPDNNVNNNFRVNPNTGGLIAVDTNLSFAPGDLQSGFSPAVVAAAHTNNVAGAASTTLVAWDFNADSLVRVGGVGGTPSPDGGVLTTVSVPPSLLAFNGGIGMDVSGATNTLYVVHDDPNTGAVSGLYTRDLTTGVESQIGPFASGVFVADLTVFIAPVPEPATSLLVAVGAGLVVRGGRRWITRRG